MKEIYIWGAGIFGLASAFWLARAGVRVKIIDPRGIGEGASGGFIGALCPHTPDNWNPKKAFQFESLKMSEDFWARVDAISGGESGYVRKGRIIPLEGERAEALAHTRKEAARQNWGDFADWDVVRCAELPVFGRHKGFGRPKGGEWAVFETLSALLHPRNAVASLASAIKNMGGEFLRAPPSQLPLSACQIWATGYEGLEALGAELGKPIGNGVKGQALLFDANYAKAPQLFIDGIHFVPHLNGGLGVGSTSERIFTEPQCHDENADALYLRACELMPALCEHKLIARWAGVRPRTLTRAPLIDRHPLRDNVFIANGGFKIGFGIAPKLGELMSALVLTGEAAIPDGFRFGAFK